MKWIDLDRNAFFVESMRDDRRDQFLLELRKVKEPDAKARMVESVKSLARKRQMVAVRQLDLHAEFIANVDVLLPTRKAAPDAYLEQPSLLPLTVFGDDRRRNVERKADMLALADRHFTVRGERTTCNSLF